jgi:hypothetical protein
MNRIQCSILPLLLFLVPTTASAQLPSTVIRTMAEEIAKKKAGDARASLPAGEPTFFAIIGLRQGGLSKLLQDFEETRSDEQLGATSTAAGTTTLVSKGTVPKVLGFAVENGAIVRSQSGTTMTFRGNAGGIVDALAGKGFIQISSADADRSRQILSRLSFSTSFDTSRGLTEGAQPTFTGDRQQLSQWSARVQIWDARDPLRREYQDDWFRLTSGAQSTLAQAAGKLQLGLESDPAFKAWLAETQRLIEALGPDAAAIEAALTAQADKFPSQANQQVLAEYDRAASAFVSGRQRILDAVAEGLQIAFEFTNDRPVNAPRTSNLRAVGAVGGMVDLTGNASVTLFDEIPVGLTRRVRDVQLSAELSVRLGSAATTGPFVLAFSGKYQRQFENSLAANGVIVPDSKGTTAIGQLKLTIPVSKGTGVKMPLSVTFANRTELIKEKEIRGNVGITYDLDSLFARFKP